MTKKEMLAEIQKQGGLDSEAALIITIKKWHELHRYWPLVSEARLHWPDDENCALCCLYDVSICTDCPLSHKNGSSNGCRKGTFYNRATGAALDGNYKRFRFWQKKLVARMRKALAREEKKHS